MDENENTDAHLIDLVCELIRSEAVRRPVDIPADAVVVVDRCDYIDPDVADAATPADIAAAVTQAAVSARLEQVLRAVTAHLIVEAEQVGASKQVLAAHVGTADVHDLAAGYPALVAFRRARVAADVTGLTIPVQAFGVTIDVTPALPADDDTGTGGDAEGSDT